MAGKYLFSLSELLEMINKSAAMQSFDQAKREMIIAEVAEVESEKAQKLYAALIQERENYNKIDKQYITDTGKVMDGLSVEVVGIKHQYINKQINTAEAKAQQAEDETAENILQSLN